MRWKWPSRPRPGDERERNKFLLLPRRIAGETRWLERAKWLEYHNGFGWMGLCWAPEDEAQ